MTEPLTANEVNALLPPPDSGLKDWLFDHPESLIIIVLFLMVLMFMGMAAGFFGCWQVPLEEARYCNRIGFAAYEAKADSAYWLRHGLPPE